MVLSQIHAEKPAPSFALEAIGRIAFSGTDIGTALDNLNTDSTKSCGVTAFDSGAYGAASQGPNANDNGGHDNIYNAFGQCGGDDNSQQLGIVSNARSVVVCNNQVVLTSLVTGSQQMFHVDESTFSKATSGVNDVMWVESVVAPAAGLNPPVWTITAHMLNVASGAQGAVQLPTPKSNGVPAQTGNVAIEDADTDYSLVSVAADDATTRYVISPAGKVLHVYNDVNNSTVLNGDRIVPELVHTGAQSDSATADFFDATIGQFVTVPHYDDEGDTKFVSDAGCGREGLVLHSSQSEAGGPNYEYTSAGGKLKPTQVIDFQWDGGDGTVYRPVGLVSSGLVVTYSTTSGDRLGLLSLKTGKIDWSIGSDLINVDQAAVELGEIVASNNSNQTVVVDPTTGKEAAGLSDNAMKALAVADTSWLRLPKGSKDTVWVGLSGSSAFVLQPADGICA